MSVSPLPCLPGTTSKAAVILETSRLIIEKVRDECKFEPDKENNVFGVTPIRLETMQKRSVHDRLGSVFVQPLGHNNLGTTCRVFSTLENR